MRKSGRYSSKTLGSLIDSKVEDINLRMIKMLIFSLHRDSEVDKSHAFLVFLPGWDHISDLDQMIKEEPIAFAVRIKKMDCHFGFCE